jgi:carbohydrate kinase (thermoresistant glucokinase family)
MIILVMGVSGSGKTTVGAMLAGRLGWEYAEADDFHPAANVEKMHAGIPLTDEDRWPWLDRIAAWIDSRQASGASAVVSCSALKRIYRDKLRSSRPTEPQDRPGMVLVYLEGSRELIGRRLAARHGHFFPATLLDSQFAALEPPAPDEHAIVVPITDSPAEAVDTILKAVELP